MCPRWGLNSDLWDRKPNCFQLNHLTVGFIKLSMLDTILISYKLTLNMYSYLRSGNTLLSVNHRITPIPCRLYVQYKYCLL